MKKIHKILVASNTPIVEINLQQAIHDREITLEDITKALELLYGNRIDAIKLKDVYIEPLQEEIIRDYILSFNIDNTPYIAYNFACCFIDSKDADSLFGKNEEEAFNNVMQTLKILRQQDFNEHPLYYTNYAKKIIQTYKHFISN